MSRPWSIVTSLLKAIARIRIPLMHSRHTDISIGEPGTLDALGSTGWRDFASSERLFDCWGPVPGTVWEAFHCATLFAALDRIPKDRVAPAPESWIPQWLQQEMPAPRWLDSETWLILDGPGETSVAIAAHLASLQQCQPVCTFDNWPHAAGLVKPERVLAALLRYVPWVAHARRSWDAGLPPVWVCDDTRLGTRSGVPNEFDNRYFLDDSILPGPEILHRAGITRVVYASPGQRAAQTADLTEYFQFLVTSGFALYRIGLDDGQAWQSQPEPFQPIVLTSVKKSGFFRSSAGGFGVPIPEPSSSSG
jgi:hypothetical protein